MRTKIVPVIFGALGTIEKGLDQNLAVAPCHLSATELQKIPLMSTAHSSGKCWGTLLSFVVEIWNYLITGRTKFTVVVIVELVVVVVVVVVTQ